MKIGLDEKLAKVRLPLPGRVKLHDPCMQSPCIGVRDRGGGGRGQLPHTNFGKPWKFGQMLGKIKKIRADLSENRLNSGNFITILHINSGKLSTAP
jgi:hypothetical protein